jgi:NAD(P)-dependent dehydrogenase (short-subunit alcohol dehydrogenase family)
VNVAGVWHDDKIVYYGPHLEDTPAAQINEVLDVGIRAPMLLTRNFLRGMIQKRRGKVLNISGTFSSGGAGWLHYYVSKKAIEYFTIGLADELRVYEIQVNCISPSDVATEALKRFFPEDATTAISPDDVARFAIFLLSDEIADNVTGQIIVIKNKIAH